MGHCARCATAFTSSRSARRRYCSQECAKNDQHGAGNGNWKGGRLTLAQILRACPKNRSLIAAVLRRDHFTCRSCGQVGGDLEVDHIHRFADILTDFLREHNALDTDIFAYELYLQALKYRPFWSRKNLQTLCRKCNWAKQLKERLPLRAAGEHGFCWSPADRGEMERVLGS